MTNAILGWPSVTDQFTLSGGNWRTPFPRSNLQTLPLSKVARSVSLAAGDTVIIATSSTTRRVGILGLARHNGTVAATMRTRLYGDAAMTNLLYDSGIGPLWQEVYPYETLEWEDDQYWSGRYTPGELAGANWLWVWWIAKDYMAAAIRLDISDPGNPEGFFQAGYLEIAGAYQAEFNFQPGAQYGFRFRTILTEALGGAKYADDRAKPRVFKGSFHASHNEALAKFFELVRQRDICEPVLWLPEPDIPVNWVRTAMLGQLVDPGMFSYVQLDLDDVPLSLEEIIG